MKLLKESVHVVMLNEYNELLAVSRKDNHYDMGLVGGKVDEDDRSLKDAIIREIKEETGLNVRKKDLHRIFQTHKYGYMGYTFLCTKYSGKIQTDEPHIVKWTCFNEVIKGSFGKYNKLVYECLVDMDVKAIL